MHANVKINLHRQKAKPGIVIEEKTVIANGVQIERKI